MLETIKQKQNKILNNPINLNYVLDILENKKKRLIFYQNKKFENFQEEIEILQAAIDDLKGRYSK